MVLLLQCVHLSQGLSLLHLALLQQSLFFNEVLVYLTELFRHKLYLLSERLQRHFIRNTSCRVLTLARHLMQRTPFFIESDLVFSQLRFQNSDLLLGFLQFSQWV